MNALNMVLDATHLCDDAFWDALEIYTGPVWASHNNCRSLVNHNRQFDDNQLKTIINRNGVIGAAFDAWMIVPEWIRGVSNPKKMNCNLNKLIDHMIHICGLAGNSNHIAIGSDLDGAFGTEQSPFDIDTIADLQLLPEALSNRGFTDVDITRIMHQNWIDFLQRNLPD
jgi:membrane dipeptidase